MKTVFVAVFAGFIGCALFQPAWAAESASVKEKVVWSFGSGTDGQTPEAGLINESGVLYGTTSFGGAKGEGTLFSIDPATGAETVLYSFCTKRHL